MVSQDFQPQSSSDSTEATANAERVQHPVAEDLPFESNVAVMHSDDRENIQANDNESNENALQQDQLVGVVTPFVGRWNRLISQTNWEKGCIIVQWRNALIDSAASPQQYSDEAWSRAVEGVTPQHVGRLRRVYDRFQKSYESYQGLYWTHFLAALDWTDAELWLEGAVQSKWSVSQMRRMRWEVLGSDPAAAPQENEVTAVESDEGYNPLVEAEQDNIETDRELQDRIGTTGPLNEGPDFGEGESEGNEAEEYQDTSDDDDRVTQVETISPFAKLPQLPVDIADALEQFKLAIVRHRASQWQDITPNEIVEVLDALKTFATISA